jgi:outer membrane protein assembly factor BamB
VTHRIWILCSTVAAVGWLWAAIGACRAEGWPQFRGPGGQGHAGAVGLPLLCSETENVRWKTPIEGRGWSSPIVLGGHVWLTTAQEHAATPEETKLALARVAAPVPRPQVARGLTLMAVCVDRSSGRLVHQRALFEIGHPTVICAVNSFASPTPVAEQGRVFCDFGALGTACLDAATGDVLWTRHLPIDHQVGSGSSPVLYRELLVLVRDGCDRQYVTALDKKTGRTVWETRRPPMDADYLPYRKAFSTPLIIRVDGADQMVVPAAQWIVSYDPATGKERWRVNTGGTFSNSSRPVYGHGMVYVCTAYGGSRMLAIRCGGQGDVTGTHVVWELQRQTPKRSSPLLVGDQLYFVSDGGIATCVDARTGATHWSERVARACSASPICADGRIYVCGEEGAMVVLQPGKEFAKLAAGQIDDRIMASPAALDGALYLRSGRYLWKFVYDG